MMAGHVPGRRLCSAASTGLIVVGLLHLWGHVRSSIAGPQNEAEADLQQAMRGYSFEIGGMRPSMMEIVELLSLGFTILLVIAGSQALVALRLATDRHRAVRAVALVGGAGSGALAAAAWWYSVPPPLVTLALVFALYVGALVRQNFRRQS